MTTNLAPAIPKNLMLFILSPFIEIKYHVDKLWRMSISYYIKIKRDINKYINLFCHNSWLFL